MADQIFLTDVQDELIPLLVNRWTCTDPASNGGVTDDAGFINLNDIGSPLYGAASLVKNDVASTCVYGSIGNFFTGFTNEAVNQAGILFGNSGQFGGAIEGLTAAEPNGNSFYLLSVPGQMAVKIVGGVNVAFTVWTSNVFNGAVSPTTLTATNVLKGWPQHIFCNFDPTGGPPSMKIYVDNVVVASGSPGTTTTQLGLTTQEVTTCTTDSTSFTVSAIPTTYGMQIGGTVTGPNIPASTVINSIPSTSSLVLNNKPTSTGTGKAITVQMPIQIAAAAADATSAVAAAQDIAVYSQGIAVGRITQHFKAFRQILSDPNHVRVYPQIGVYS